MASCLAQLHKTEETLKDLVVAWQASLGYLLQPISIFVVRLILLGWCKITGCSPSTLSGAAAQIDTCCEVHIIITSTVSAILAAWRELRRMHVCPMASCLAPLQRNDDYELPGDQVGVRHWASAVRHYHVMSAVSASLSAWREVMMYACVSQGILSGATAKAY